MGKISLYILHGDSGFDVSDMVKQVVWSGKKSAAARTIEVTMLDDFARKEGRVGMELTQGVTCILKWNGEELFRGIIMKQSVTQARENKWKAYDVCMYLANSKDSFTYNKVTATTIIGDCCKRAGLPTGQSVDTGYVIESLVKQKTTYYDCILDALSNTYQHTGNRFYIRAMGNAVVVLKRSEELTQWVLEYGENITGYNYTESIEKIKTKYRIYSKEGKVLKEATNAELQSALGTLTAIDQADEDYTDASLKEMVDTLIKENGYPEKSLSISALGIISAISGGCLYVKIPHLNLERTFYIDEDKHTFNGESHMMQLKLNFAG